MIGSQSRCPREGGNVEGLVETVVVVVVGMLAAVRVGTALSFCPIRTLSCSDSKLQEELRSLREMFSNFTVSTEAKVTDLRTQGEGAGAEAEGLWNTRDMETLSKCLPQEEVWAER